MVKYFYYLLQVFLILKVIELTETLSKCCLYIRYSERKNIQVCGATEQVLHLFRMSHEMTEEV